jgi:hypothetical protein
VRVIRTGVHLQFAVHRFPHLRLGQHAVHRVFDQLGWLPLPDQAGALLAQAAFVAAMLAVNLLIFLAPGHLDLGGIDHDHEIARIDERGVGRFVLALEQAGRERRETSEHLALRVDDVPGPACSGLIGADHETRH